MRLYEVYYDNSTRKPYNDSMTSLGGNNLPYITTEEQVKIKVHILNSDDISAAYTGFVGELVSATATVDDNFDWAHSGVSLTDLTGAVTEIPITYTGNGYVNPIGQISLKNSGELSEVINYTSFTNVDDAYTFVVDKTLVNSYLIGDVAKIAEVPLIRATSVDTTGKDTGIFEIELEADALRYLEEIQGEERLSTCRFELLIRDSSAVLIYSVAFKFICLNVQDFNGVMPSPADPSGYFTSVEVSALLAGYMKKLGTSVEDGLMTFDDVGEVQTTAFRIEGNKIIGPDGAGGEGYMQFVLVNGVMTMDINKEL